MRVIPVGAVVKMKKREIAIGHIPYSEDTKEWHRFCTSYHCSTIRSFCGDDYPKKNENGTKIKLIAPCDLVVVKNFKEALVVCWILDGQGCID